jgi:hypothetical protein
MNSNDKPVPLKVGILKIKYIYILLRKYEKWMKGVLKLVEKEYHCCRLFSGANAA